MFSVVIPTWNRRDYLTAAIDSLMRQKCAELEILVIDNGSSDGTREYCLELAGRDARLRYFRFDENKGIVVAENKGLTEAKGDIIFCMDDDELADDDELLRKVEALSSEKAWDLLNIGIVNTRTGECDNQHIFSHSRKAKTILHRSFYVNNFGNGTVFIKRKVIKEIGTFEESYFRQGQENEYAIRAVLHGFNILHYPKLLLKHQVAQSRPAISTVFYYMLRNTLLKNYKYFSGVRLYLLQSWQLVQFSGRMLLGRISPRLMFRALREYVVMRKTISRMTDYDPAAMRRYFFVSRRVATTPEAIGQLGFFQYYVLGLSRFF